MSDIVTGHNRKHEFMMTAFELFYKKGYENTTINDIIDELGLTKGAFYHYFESKEDVIVAIARDFTDRVVQIIKKIFARTNLSAVEKMNMAFEAINEYKIKEGEWRHKFKASIESEENLKLQRKITIFLKQEVAGLYEELIITGAREGIFGDPVNSQQLAEFFLNTIFSLHTSVYELEKQLYDDRDELDYPGFLRLLDEKVRFYETILGRIFQLQQGSFDFRTSYLKIYEQEE
jgi:AcrR family transcriptional regulator